MMNGQQNIEQLQRFILSSQAVMSWWVFLGLPTAWKESTVLTTPTTKINSL
jgi:hypothetical protein